MHSDPNAALPENLVKWIIISILLIRCLFLAIPPNQIIHPFLFTDQGIYSTSYTWVIAEHIALCWLVYQWWRDTSRKTSFVFLMMCGLDFADFILRANTPWFYAWGYPITNNVFFIICGIGLTLDLDAPVEKTRH